MATGNRVKSTGSKAGENFGKGLKSLCYFLTILFCALRACDVIDWPWSVSYTHLTLPTNSRV